MRDKGVIVLRSEEDLDMISQGTVIIRSHGVEKRIYEKIEQKGLRIVDATCPFVKKIHNIVSEKSGEGFHIIIIGNPEHPEVVGIKGWAKDNVTVIQSAEAVSYTHLDVYKRQAVDFVNFCDAFSIPVLTLTNVEGFSATLDSEKDMARAVARMTYAFAEATVPKVNVIIGNAYGSAYIAMNSKSIGADMVYAWENAKIGMMDANLAARIMYDDADMETQKEKAAEYEKIQSSAKSAARRGYVDAIITPEMCIRDRVGIL